MTKKKKRTLIDELHAGPFFKMGQKVSIKINAWNYTPGVIAYVLWFQERKYNAGKYYQGWTYVLESDTQDFRKQKELYKPNQSPTSSVLGEFIKGLNFRL